MKVIPKYVHLDDSHQPGVHLHDPHAQLLLQPARPLHLPVRVQLREVPHQSPPDDPPGTWLAHYPASRLVIVDGEQLRSDPVSVMAGLQHKLHDYSRSLYFDKTMGFYCMKSEGRGKCLGKGKGRVYPPMDDVSSIWLSKFYWKHNENLVRLLSKVGYSTTKWLSKELEKLPDKYEYNLDR